MVCFYARCANPSLCVVVRVLEPVFGRFVCGLLCDVVWSFLCVLLRVCVCLCVVLF